jgi:hypothetical protein
VTDVAMVNLLDRALRGSPMNRAPVNRSSHHHIAVQSLQLSRLQPTCPRRR